MPVPPQSHSVGFSFTFLSEEFPEFIGSIFNDFFAASLNGKNIAVDLNGNSINVNNNFFDPARTPIGTFFDGQTPPLSVRATLPESAQATLAFSIGDVGDGIFDSAVFISDVRFFTPTLDFLFPLTGPHPVYLNTEAGGQAFDGELDQFHTGGGFHSLDFDTIDEQTASVISAKAGEIVRARVDDRRVFGPDDDPPFNNTTVTIYHDQISDPAEDEALFTEYRHFTLGEELRELITSCEKQGNYDAVSGLITSCVDGRKQVAAGAPLGSLTGIQGEFLHFQVKQSMSKSIFGPGLSGEEHGRLRDTTVGGRLFTDYQLRNAGGELLNPGEPLIVEGLNIGTQLHGQNLPLLPNAGDDGIVKFDAFNFNVVAGEFGLGVEGTPVFIDPQIAVGYDYQVLAGPPFASVLLPHVGDDLFELWLFDSLLGTLVFDRMLEAGIHHVFAPGGVDFFRILGIEATAALDPDDPTAFVTGITFTTPGLVSITQTPIVQETIPEPGTALLFITSAVLLLALRRRMVSVDKWDRQS